MRCGSQVEALRGLLESWGLGRPSAEGWDEAEEAEIVERLAALAAGERGLQAQSGAFRPALFINVLLAAGLKVGCYAGAQPTARATRPAGWQACAGRAAKAAPAWMRPLAASGRGAQPACLLPAGCVRRRRWWPASASCCWEAS